MKPTARRPVDVGTSAVPPLSPWQLTIPVTSISFLGPLKVKTVPQLGAASSWKGDQDDRQIVWSAASASGGRAGLTSTVEMAVAYRYPPGSWSQNALSRRARRKSSQTQRLTIVSNHWPLVNGLYRCRVGPYGCCPCWKGSLSQG